jgi:hypothetical protein
MILPIPTLTAHTARFRTAALAFDELIARPQWGEPAELLRPLQCILPGLYATGASLPRIDPSPAANDPGGLSVEVRHDRYRRIAACLGPKNLYWGVDDPSLPEPSQTVAGSLADDLVDIAADLKRGFAFWDRNDHVSMLDAVWNWRFLWEIHWGAHAVDAIRAIHWHLGEYHQGISLEDRFPVFEDL